MVALPGSVPVARRVCFKSCVIFFLPYYVPFGAAASTGLRVFSKFSLGDDSTVDLILGARDADQAESDGFLRRLDDDR